MNDPVAGLQAQSRIMLSGYVLDLASGELLAPDGQLAGLRKQALEVLLVLGRRTGHVVAKDELMRQVWPGLVVGEGSLTQAIADVRRVLDDRDHLLVRNVARRGYMLVPRALPPEPVLDAHASEEGVPGGSFHAAGPVSAPAPTRRRWLAGTAASLALAAALGWWAWTALRPSAPTAGPFSIVVLPLAHDAAEGDARWFADVLHADLIAQLGQLSGTLVISRETAAAVRGAFDPRTVARELQVRWVVNGSVRREGQDVYLRLAMTDGASGAQQWARQVVVDRAALQQALDEFTLLVARSLQVQMYRSSAAQAAALPASRLRADDVAMQGWGFYFRGLTPQNLNLALERFEAALALDASSIRAWGGVQAVMGIGGLLNWVPRDQALARLQQAVLRLQELDADDYYTYSAKTLIASLQSDWDTLLLTATATTERFPSMPNGHTWRAGALAALGRFDECIEAGRSAVRRGPRDYSVGASYMYIGTCHFMRGEYREAAAAARAGHESNPALPSPPVLLVASLVQLGQLEEARDLAAEYLRRSPDYRADHIEKFLRGRDPRYIEGRDRVIASLRAAGMP